MNKFLKISVWVLTIGAIACLWYFTHKEHVEHPLKGLELTVMRETEKGFIDKDIEYQRIMKICDTAVINPHPIVCKVGMKQQSPPEKQVITVG